MFDTRTVEIFNEMKGDYDQITDLWYSWLFCRLHYLIAKNIITDWKSEKKVLDIGCGTGFQSFFYAKFGADVKGIDISDKLIELANEKSKYFDSKKALNLFDAQYEFVDNYHRKIELMLSDVNNTLPYIPPTFLVGDAQQINVESESYDHINCCGSTLSFIPEHLVALKEIYRCLKPGGTFVLEVESKNNLDLLWPLLDASVLFGQLEYETSIKEATGQLFGHIGKHIQVEYPFGDVRNPIYMNISLYRKKKLIKELEAIGLNITSSHSIHSVTNLIPSTILDSGDPSTFLIRSFETLAKIEEKLPFYLPGCSLVLFGCKKK